ncbi:hypothetical protein PHMEG_00013920 [Phytophthora megakarya]|uniref:Reverse transcriptase RNase H-like domain-containing protein n=1 Tax=Phytophthora megakarya TaxID=4795 RepID=A0A225W6L4_9STRA|nr:hypothetical protein PHMEG_00013920 [Phytophthora megakarya]
MLVCRGGAFTKSQVNWSVVEKKGYPIARACRDLESLLDRENGVHIYCDHSNLIQIFAPGREDKQHVKGKLQRWALRFNGCRYTCTRQEGHAWCCQCWGWACHYCWENLDSPYIAFAAGSAVYSCPLCCSWPPMRTCVFGAVEFTFLYPEAVCQGVQVRARLSPMQACKGWKNNPASMDYHSRGYKAQRASPH